jgi:hypothetical protein
MQDAGVLQGIGEEADQGLLALLSEGQPLLELPDPLVRALHTCKPIHNNGCMGPDKFPAAPTVSIGHQLHVAGRLAGTVTNAVLLTACACLSLTSSIISTFLSRLRDSSSAGKPPYTPTCTMKVHHHTSTVCTYCAAVQIEVVVLFLRRGCTTVSMGAARPGLANSPLLLHGHWLVAALVP